MLDRAQHYSLATVAMIERSDFVRGEFAGQLVTLVTDKPVVVPGHEQHPVLFASGKPCDRCFCNNRGQVVGRYTGITGQFDFGKNIGALVVGIYLLHQCNRRRSTAETKGMACSFPEIVIDLVPGILHRGE